jgi:hypothetical protein
VRSINVTAVKSKIVYEIPLFFNDEMLVKIENAVVQDGRIILAVSLENESKGDVGFRPNCRKSQNLLH